jgi:hypothetical protein
MALNQEHEKYEVATWNSEPRYLFENRVKSREVLSKEFYHPFPTSECGLNNRTVFSISTTR